MAQAVSRHGSSGSIPGQRVWDSWWTKWHWDRFFFPLSVWFHQRITLVFIKILLLPEAQTVEGWEPSKSNALLEIVEHWIEKYFHVSLVFKGIITHRAVRQVGSGRWNARDGIVMGARFWRNQHLHRGWCQMRAQTSSRNFMTYGCEKDCS
jgi:hypothetical protein